MPNNHARIHSLESLLGVEVLIANFTDYQFDAHWHETWSMGAVLDGAHDNSPKATGEGIVSSGQVTVIAPGEVHAGQVVGKEGCRYVMFYFMHSELQSALEQLDKNLDPFSIATLEAPDLYREIVRCAQVLSDSTSTKFDIEVSWTRCLSMLIDKLANTLLPAKHALNIEETKRLQTARAYLESHSNSSITLEQLSKESNMSKYHLCRQFSEVFNISPNRYLRQIRLHKARQLLRQGLPILEVAMSCGFSDQSHLGRQFKAAFGVTPNSYASQFK